MMVFENAYDDVAGSPLIPERAAIDTDATSSSASLH